MITLIDEFQEFKDIPPCDFEMLNRALLDDFRKPKYVTRLSVFPALINTFLEADILSRERFSDDSLSNIHPRGTT